MAEGGYHQVHLRAGEKPVCDLCETKLDNQLSKCLDCDVYICDKCSLAHKKLPATKNHNVISRVERESKKISKISRMCSSHPNDEVMYYCFTCMKLICSECITDVHKKHDCIKIKAFAKQKRKELKTNLDRMKNKDIPKMKSKLDKIQQQSNLNDETTNKNLQKLKKRKQQLMSDLEKINKEIETECDKLHQRNKDKLKAAETNVTKDLSEMETLCSDFTKTLHTGSDLKVIIAEQEISEKLESVKSSDMDTELHLPSFTEGKTDDKILKTMYGSLQPGEDVIPVSTTTDVVINQFHHKSTIVYSICPLTDNTALINYRDLYDNDIVSVDGAVQKTLHFEFIVSDFVMTSHGEIMSTDGGEPNIYKLTKEGVITDTINTAPLYPVSLCESRDGNLLVSLIDDCEDLYTINESSRRCVSRMTMKGKILQSYEYNKGSRLFTLPLGVSENINKDMCVVNQTGETTGHLIILDKTGMLKCTYNGQRLEREFIPAYVKCDKLGHIIVNDPYNLKVHMLDSEGQFIRYIITENNMSDAPWSLAVDNKTGVLWVGGHKGHIYTIRYLK